MSSDHSEHIRALITSAMAFKSKHSKLWIPSHEKIVEDLRDIMDMYEFNNSMAVNQFISMDISKYPTFESFVYNTMEHARGSVKSTIERSKTSRSHRGNKQCQQCGANSVILDGGVYVCAVCRNERHTSKTGNSPVTREIIDPSKHTLKQLNILMGKTSPPQNMKRVMKYITTWFVHKNYLFEWLLHSGTYDKWVTKYQQFNNTTINESYFADPVQRTQDNLCNYKTFKLFTDSFYDMTIAVSRNRMYESNMDTLEESEIIDVCKSYARDIGRIPVEGEVYEPTGECRELGDMSIDYNTMYPVITLKYTSFQIGNYYAKMLTKDIDAATPFKQQLCEIFNSPMRFPGLMFEYNDVFPPGGNVPKKFVYQQNYVFIIHSVYNVPFCEITEHDKQIMCDLIMDFNAFFKKSKNEKSGKDHNSCLWQISLSCILGLPYFRCYRNILRIMPEKNGGTLASIQEMWVKYRINNPEKIRKYTVSRTAVQTETIQTTKVEDVQVCKDEMSSYINKTDNFFDSDKNDMYLMKKQNMTSADFETDWDISDFGGPDAFGEPEIVSDLYADDTHEFSNDFSEE